MKSWRIVRPLLAGAALCVAAAATGQLLPGGLPGLGGGALGGALSPITRGGEQRALPIVPTPSLDLPALPGALGRGDLLALRRARLREFVRTNRSQLEADEDGAPVRRGEIIAIDAAPDVVRAAEEAGFSVLRREDVAELGIAVVVLQPPAGKSARDGLKRLRKLVPGGSFALNHVFEPAGQALGPAGKPAVADRAGSGAIGMIDGGVAAHPSLARARIEQRGFTAAGPKPSGHGTAVASLLVGEDGRFAGAARGRSLLVADVYGGDPAAGSAEAIARALGWLAGRGARVISISLIGPANPLLERAIAAVERQGVLVVAAVGNDGPAAPPQYPAAYPGVVAVTGVDARDRALPEAGRAAHLDFAAPGADMAAALPGGGYAEVRGTSFATPLVAARLAEIGGGGRQALDRAAGEAAPGKGKVGRGILCKSCRIDPQLVRAKS